ncbi:pilus assembly protein CpaB [Geodermatophilus saharensis]|uniref:Pilus assembly protein CpaB n=1 Tax=Geodermatophilus saharensis TaxID=1137994 RepID=A0A239BMC8_9ACTN|nr:RcpC/CpaB family pilus assembly protein [Geodermatophilus saharensis]SNS09120.1 pilus assembly protein CpaB [Geodermatophilus saharensis]
MRRRLLAATAALVLVAAGTVVLLAYVRGADARALAGVRTVQVLVVDQPIPEGTPAEEVAGLVRTELLPVKAAVDGRVTELGQLAGQVATADLAPGEQLLAARFAAPEDLQAPGTVPVPEGLSEVSLVLEPQRAVGGRLAAGDEIGVYISMELQGNIDADPDEEQIGTTHATLHGVLVTQVQGAPAPAADGGDVETASATSAAPTENVMVTVALPARDAERVVFGMEHATVWLSLEREGTDTSGTRVVTQGNIYGDLLAALGSVAAEASE